jgi:hypothetical protein
MSTCIWCSPARLFACFLFLIVSVGCGSSSLNAQGDDALAAEEDTAVLCDDFFDQWEIPGVPATMLAMGGIGREMMAAMDCVEKNDIEKACLHWHKIIEVTDKLGPPYNQDRAGIEALMREHKCAARAEDAAGATAPNGNVAKPDESASEAP